MNNFSILKLFKLNVNIVRLSASEVAYVFLL